MVWEQSLAQELKHAAGVAKKTRKNLRKVEEFPGDLVIRTQCFHHYSLGSIPGLGTKNSSQTTAHSGQKKKKKQSKHIFSPTEVEGERNSLAVQWVKKPALLQLWCWSAAAALI